MLGHDHGTHLDPVDVHYNGEHDGISAVPALYVRRRFCLASLFACYCEFTRRFPEGANSWNSRRFQLSPFYVRRRFYLASLFACSCEA